MSGESFGAVAPALWDRGWRGLIPIKIGDKAPAPRAWERFADGRQTRQDLDELTRFWPWHGIGATTGTGLTVIDLDCDDLRGCQRALDVFERHLDVSPLVVVGQAPRGKIFYRGAFAAGKWKAPRGLAIEIYHGGTGGGAGQTVLFGTHPKTHRPYFWPRKSPLETDLTGEVPEITEAALVMALDEIAGLGDPSLRAVKRLGAGAGVPIDQTLMAEARSAMKPAKTTAEAIELAAGWVEETLGAGSRHDGTLCVLLVLIREYRADPEAIRGPLGEAFAGAAGISRESEFHRMMAWAADRQPPAPQMQFKRAGAD
ncbi:bifunctional DNA primase/polymerase [Phaeobacter marinintestinus]|uniref:bifunctional DNA primase/polymerase n=1 Tax=Falsiphaeobacter marinintestinus TaxID=1492905 RepID=UPI0011B81C29|nr:bifunctional DNA primase/polymerase [Phaeobacter marinintestinus]